MPLSQVVVVITASFLVTSEALSTTMDSDQAKVSKVVSPGASHHRLLRIHDTADEDEDTSDDSEERGLTPTQMEDYAIKKLGIDWAKSERSTAYFQSLKNCAKYVAMYNNYFQKNRGY
ncbi:hypothetical protein ON010_g4655 [Phytophthora cinnamomi]|nr:hypothetical protein ON010_g4655 [Phytophthora cinnamomi]